MSPLWAGVPHRGIGPRATTLSSWCSATELVEQAGIGGNPGPWRPPKGSLPAGHPLSLWSDLDSNEVPEGFKLVC